MLKDLFIFHIVIVKKLDKTLFSDIIARWAQTPGHQYKIYPVFGIFQGLKDMLFIVLNRSNLVNLNPNFIEFFTYMCRIGINYLSY